MDNSRKCKDWLESYLKFTERSEPPISYHTWVGASVIAGALQRRAHLTWGFETIYPNMYVVLVGPSGKARKGVALNIGKDLLKEANLPLTSEAITREALVRFMLNQQQNFKDDKNDIKFHCSITCFSEELSVFLGQNDLKFLANLTDWYDSKDEWTYETKGSGTDKLQGLCFNLLGATAPDWLQSMLPQEAVGGGFTSRIIFVVEDRKGKSVPKHILTTEELRMRESLIEDLQKIALIGGEFKFDAAGEKAYIDWYIEHDKKLDKGILPVPDPRFSGYAERKSTHLRKLAMCLSASRGNDKVLTKIDFDRARSILETVEKKMSRTFGGLGRAPNSDMTDKIIEYMRFKKTATRDGVLKQFYRDIDLATMQQIEETLLAMKVIDAELIPETGNKVYRWIGGLDGDSTEEAKPN